MRFSKIKWNGDEVHLEWTTPAKKHPSQDVHHRLQSKDKPAPEFVAALAAFIPHVGELLEVDESWMDAARVTGLSINTEDDGRRGLVVTCLRELEATNAPLVLNTPHLRDATDEDDLDGDAKFLPEEMITLREEAEAQAARYVEGVRAQADMFAGAPA